MNQKFYSLPEEKQRAILNAGFHVFSQNTYKNSPMREIAETAGISKSLLFHYFHNKKELYLYLWTFCAEITIEEMKKSGCYQQTDLFESMESGKNAKLRLMRMYPDMGTFAVKAFCEEDPEVCREIRGSMDRYIQIHASAKLENLNPDDFIPGIDLKMMYKDMYLASEGYLWEKMKLGNLNVDEMERDFSELLSFWKKIYLKKGKAEYHDD